VKVLRRSGVVVLMLTGLFLIASSVTQLRAKSFARSVCNKTCFTDAGCAGQCPACSNDFTGGDSGVCVQNP
jgi:hypothetical protein